MTMTTTWVDDRPATRTRPMVALFASVALMNIAMVGASTAGTLIATDLAGRAARIAGNQALPSLSGPIAASAIVTGCAALATLILPRNLGSAPIQRARPAAGIRLALHRPAVRLSIVAMAAAHVAMVSMM